MTDHDAREALREIADEAAKATVPIDSPNYSAEKWFIARDAALFALASLPAPTPAADFPDIGPDPFKGPREGYTLANAEARLRDAFTIQQKGVPDQTALVWRCDLLKLFHELPRLRSIEEDWREKRAVPQPPEQCANIAQKSEQFAKTAKCSEQPPAPVGPFVVENTDGKFVASFSTEFLASVFVNEGGGCYRHRAVGFEESPTP